MVYWKAWFLIACYLPSPTFWLELYSALCHWLLLQTPQLPQLTLPALGCASRCTCLSPAPLCRTWLRVWTPPHSGQLLSCTTAHLARLAAVGSWSYTALIMKLRRRGAMCQMSVHDILHCKASSQVVH